MIFKEVTGMDVMRWISKRFQGDKTIITAANKLNCYNFTSLHGTYP